MFQNNQLSRKTLALNEVNGRLREIPDKLNWLESRSESGAAAVARRASGYGSSVCKNKAK